ncbi:hypothetical protein OE88DRAFT_1668929 [Heliocybe sulcata]|uniref:Zinc finger PHD-type domain-containing protein n=1 Tax=Heliocybe sulcata TaxID=5364 RepID=A0A5C3MNQ1_9AGAM|nr:hypothetical protein OE88DRAFT_1668929 [Heliocybe sulcata]
MTTQATSSTENPTITVSSALSVPESSETATVAPIHSEQTSGSSAPTQPELPLAFSQDLQGAFAATKKRTADEAGLDEPVIGSVDSPLLIPVQEPAVIDPIELCTADSPSSGNMDVDPDVVAAEPEGPVEFCWCRGPEEGDMVRCDGPDCGEWYHFGCAGLLDEPQGEWFCSDTCKAKASSSLRIKLPALSSNKRARV